MLPDTAPVKVSARRTGKRTEVGMRFSAKVPGSATGIQVYKASPRLKATPRRASLWNSDGERIASARIQPTSAVGWITASFAKPVKLLRTRSYTASVFAKKGEYAVTRGGFAQRIERDGLVAPARRNGVIRQTRHSAVPERDKNSANYWVDIVFKPSVKGPPPPPPPPTDVFPSAETAGTPAGWVPAQTIQGSYTVSTPGAVVQDLRVNGSLVVTAPNVTLRWVDVVGGQINNFTGGSCKAGLVIEDSTVRRSTAPTTASDEPAHLRRRLHRPPGRDRGHLRGVRAGGRALGCGPVVIEDSYARVVRPDSCGDWHGDGLQGYDGPALTIRRSTISLVENGCGGTAPFFYPATRATRRSTSTDCSSAAAATPSASGCPARCATSRSRTTSGSTARSTCGARSSPSGVPASSPSCLPGVVSTVRAQACNTEEGN